ncbi:MAG: NifU family protein [Planctomycetes bacterium]|nr:NifU family protein [Planctomycetota bacterium]
MPAQQDDDLKTRVARILTEQVVPALQLDGSALEVCAVTDGVVQLRLGGSCSGCPSTLWAVVNGIEHELRQRLPEVDYVEVLP